MDDLEFQKLKAQLDEEMNGDADHDADVLNDWLDRYIEDPEAEPIIVELARRMFEIDAANDPDLAQEIFNIIIKNADTTYDEVCGLTAEGKFEEAVEKLQPVIDNIRKFRLPVDSIWMDFNSFLDSLVYQDYFSAQIGEREVARHPMKPSRILFTCGTLLIELGRAAEALVPLKMLLTYDPVCPKFLFEYGEALKRCGRMRDAYENALWAVSCASDRSELARCYRDLAYCLSEMDSFEESMILYLLSLRFQTSRQAETEIVWLQKRAGISPEQYDMETIRQRCEEMGIPIGISETVQNNIEFLKSISMD